MHSKVYASKKAKMTNNLGRREYMFSKHIYGKQVDKNTFQNTKCSDSKFCTAFSSRCTRWIGVPTIQPCPFYKYQYIIRFSRTVLTRSSYSTKRTESTANILLEEDIINIKFKKTHPSSSPACKASHPDERGVWMC